jgi:isocitrate dehydrogenase
MMLNHLGENHKANLIQNALYRTIEDGIHTGDIFNQLTSKKRATTKEFTEAVVNNLGNNPQQLPIAKTLVNNQSSTVSNNNQQQLASNNTITLSTKKLIGFDLFIDWQDNFNNLLSKIREMESEKFEIKINVFYSLHYSYTYSCTYDATCKEYLYFSVYS